MEKTKLPFRDSHSFRSLPRFSGAQAEQAALARLLLKSLTNGQLSVCSSFTPEAEGAAASLALREAAPRAQLPSAVFLRCDKARRAARTMPVPRLQVLNVRPR